VDAGVLPETPHWLERLAEAAVEPDTGVVAPITLDRAGRIAHAGLAFRIGQERRYPFRLRRFDDLDEPADGAGARRLDCLREVSAVSGQCMMFRRSGFLNAGGLDEELGRDSANIDFCLRLRALKLAVRLEGRVVMIQPDPAPRWSRALPADEQALVERRHRGLFEAERFDTTVPRAYRASDTVTVSLAAIEDR
jgi:hypothetical protein